MTETQENSPSEFLLSAGGQKEFEGALGASALESTRNPFVEGLRVVAAIGIVWFHAGAPGRELAYAGLSAFLIIAFYFETQNAGRSGRSSSAARYLIPWLFWFAFYGLARLARHGSFFPDYKSDSLLSQILAGPSLHLWYLPFIFVMVSIVRAALETPLRDVAFPLGSAALLAVVATCSSWWTAADQVGPPIVQYAQALPAVLLGVALGASDGSLGSRIVTATLLAALVAVGIPLTNHFGLQDALAAIAFIAALVLPAWTPAYASNFGDLPRLTYGVYLIHPAFLSLAKSYVSPLASVQAILASIAAFLATWVIRRYGGRFGRAIT